MRTPLWMLLLSAHFAGAALTSPYPQSSIIDSLDWHWSTRQTAAPGSDLWPVTWGPDDQLYAAWGDGGGFGGSDSEGRVALGFARIEGTPENWRGFNVNGGKEPEHSAAFPKLGKTTGLAFVDGTLYATVNLQDGAWPNVDHVLVWSTDRGRTWSRAGWLFAKGEGNFQPAKFVAFGRDYTGLPDNLAGYVYLCGPRHSAKRGGGNRLYLARAPRTRLRDRNAYEFFQSAEATGRQSWVSEIDRAEPVFSDPNGVTAGTIVYVPGLRRFLLTCFHVGPGQLGVFEGQNPWGPWKTIAYDENWGEMGSAGEGLTCGFPQKWMSADGLTLWSVFSVYGEGAKQGIKAHDCFNLVKVTLHPATKQLGDSQSLNLAAQSTLPQGPGLAAAFKGDSGLATNPAVLFADNFETGELGGRWDDKSKSSVLSLAPSGDDVCGRRCLKVEARLGQNQGGGLTKWFNPSPEVFIRFYVRFDPTCDYIHHFVTLRANKGLHGGDKWTGFGGAGVRPTGEERFSTALEPWGNWERWPAPGKWNFYSYWHEMKASPDGKFWGNSFLPEAQDGIPKNRWICAEFMLKENTPNQPDGEQAFWIDGRLLGHWRGINWRKSESLHANALTLESYVTDRWTKNPTNIVYFDNLVIAKQYIGPAGR